MLEQRLNKILYCMYFCIVEHTPPYTCEQHLLDVTVRMVYLLMEHSISDYTSIIFTDLLVSLSISTPVLSRFRTMRRKHLLP